MPSFFAQVLNHVLTSIKLPISLSRSMFNKTQNSADTCADIGQRLIPTIIDKNAERYPDKCACMVPCTTNLEDGFKPITWLQLANVINFISWWIQHNLGRSETFDTIAFYGASDLEYAVMTVAAQKTGYRIFFSSLWNDVETHVHLLGLAGCKYLITSETQTTLVDSLMTKKSMRYFMMPDLTDGHSYRSCTFKKTFREAQAEPFAVFHTSGSIGFPKLIVITHAAMAACDAFQNAHISGYPQTQVGVFKNKRVFAGVPPFHAAGMFHLLAMPAFYGSLLVIGPLAPPTALRAQDLIKYGNINILILQPNILSKMCDDPICLDLFGKLDYVMNAACVLSKAIGDKIAAKTSVMTHMGATETLLVPFELRDLQDWEYIAPSGILGAQFRHHHADLYELIIIRQQNLKAYQVLFHTFPDLQAYSMKDLYSKHPTNPNLWRYRGRVDDVVQLSGGRKILPETMETGVASIPEAKTAVVLGQAREDPALLIETQEEPAVDRSQLLETISKTLEVVNEAAPEHARISSDHVLFASPAKPLARTAKGAVQRNATSKLYEEELDRLDNEGS